MACNHRCWFSTSPVNKCTCSCGGKNHGVAYQVFGTLGDFIDTAFVFIDDTPCDLCGIRTCIALKVACFGIERILCPHCKEVFLDMIKLFLPEQVVRNQRREPDIKKILSLLNNAEETTWTKSI